MTYGHSSYVLSQAATLEEAQAAAQSYGGNLVTIDDAGEEQWLIDTFGFDANNDYVIEIEWSSIGGNDTILGGAGDDQVYGNSGNDVIFGDNETTVPKTPGTLTFQQGVNGYNSTVDTFLQGSSPSQNNSNATSLNVDSDDLGDPVHSLIRFEDIFGSQLGQIALDDTIDSAFLEINVSNPGNSFKVHELLQTWSDSSTWNSWSSGIQANDIEAASTPVVTTDWVNTGILRIDVTASLQAWQANPNANHGWAFLSTGTDGVDFDSAEGNIAPRLVVDVNQGSSNGSDIPTADIYNGSRYLVTDTAMTWTDAQAYAESIGGNLVTINDAAENQWLKDTFGTTEALWIGFTDRETEGTWKWASGEGADWILGADNTGIYADWAPTQPDDHDNLNQDYAILSNIWDANTDKWDDVQSGPLFRGIIEIKLSGTASGGNDNLFGNGGHDTIDGGAGNDTINGTDEIVAGNLERDDLEGGSGADTFILGDDTQAYYATGGGQDYALIKDFDSSLDIIQLHGVAGDYQQQQQGDDIHLSRNGDLVAILENNSTLDLNGSGFAYVSVV